MKRYLVVLTCLALLCPTPDARTADFDLPELIGSMTSNDVGERREASFELSHIGPAAKPAVPALVKGLDDRDPQVWLNSAAAIAHIGPGASDAIPKLISELESSRRSRGGEQGWYRMAYALGQIGPAALPELEKAFSHERDYVRAGAAKAITWMGADAASLRDDLLKLLADDSELVRTAAAEALGSMPAEAAPGVLAALAAEQPEVREAAARALHLMPRLSEDQLSLLADAADKESHPAARVAMIDTLSRFNLKPERFIPILGGAVASDHEALWHAAVNALILMDPPATTSVPALTRFLAGDDERTRTAAATVVRQIGPPAVGATDVLITARNREPGGSEIAELMENALQSLGPDAVPAIFNAAIDGGQEWPLEVLAAMGSRVFPVVRSELDSGDAGRSVPALRVLARIGTPAAGFQRELMEMANEGDPRARGAALSALSRISPESELLLPIAIRALNDDAAEVRRGGAEVIASLGPKASTALPRLVALLEDAEPRVALQAVRAIGALGDIDPESAAALRDRLDDAEVSLAVAVVNALSNTGQTPSSASRFLELIERKVPLITIAVIDAFSRMDEPGEAELEAVRSAVAHPDSAVRVSAIRALARVEPEADRKFEFLRAGLGDDDEAVRSAAVDWATELEEGARPVSAALFGALERGGEERKRVLRALREVEPDDEALLIAHAKHDDSEVRDLVVSRMGAMASPAFLPVLEEMDDDPDGGVRRQVRRAVRSIREAEEARRPNDDT